MTISKMKVADLRKLAESKAVEGWQDMKKPELLAALEALETPKTPEASVEAAKSDESKPTKTELPVGLSEGQAAYEGKVARMKEHLMAQPKVRILIPLESGEKKGATLSVILNGYRLNITKGIYVEVPEQVAEVVMESQKQSNILVEHPLRVDESNKALNE